MTLTIESLDILTHVDGVPVRAWRGRTPNGVPCLVFVARLAVDQSEDASEFVRELIAMAPPREFEGPAPPWSQPTEAPR